MATVSTNEFKGGLKIMLDNEPCVILENEYVKPGKGQAFNRVRIRKLLTGKVLEKPLNQVTQRKLLMLSISIWITCTTMANSTTS